MQYYPVRNKIAMLRNGGKNEKTNTVGQKEHKDPEDCPCSLSKFTPASFYMYFSFPINFLLFSLKKTGQLIYTISMNIKGIVLSGRDITRGYILDISISMTFWRR